MSNKEKYNEFLKEYEKICKKYDVIISACGCCDSPFIINADNQIISKNIKHLRKELEDLLNTLKNFDRINKESGEVLDFLADYKEENDNE